MTLLLTVLAAIISTVAWYRMAPNRTYRIDILCWVYWGASIMWLADAISDYLKQKNAYFTPSLGEMLNDAYLGLSVITLGLLIWLIILLIKDPKGVLPELLKKKK